MAYRTNALMLGAALLLSAATPALAQGTGTTTTTATDTTMPVTGDRDDGDEGKWGLLGLLGLAGLLGLKRRDRDHNHVNTNNRL